MKYIYQYITLTILTLTDIFITFKIVGYDVLLELNPYSAWLIGNYGYTGLFLAKFIPLVILLLLLFKLKRESYIVKFFLGFSIVIYLLVLIPGFLILL